MHRSWAEAQRRSQNVTALVTECRVSLDVSGMRRATCCLVRSPGNRLIYMPLFGLQIVVIQLPLRGATIELTKKGSHICIHPDRSLSCERFSGISVGFPDLEVHNLSYLH